MISNICMMLSKGSLRYCEKILVKACNARNPDVPDKIPLKSTTINLEEI